MDFICDIINLWTVAFILIKKSKLTFSLNIFEKKEEKIWKGLLIVRIFYIHILKCYTKVFVTQNKQSTKLCRIIFELSIHFIFTNIMKKLHLCGYFFFCRDNIWNYRAEFKNNSGKMLMTITAPTYSIFYDSFTSPEAVQKQRHFCNVDFCDIFGS